MAAGTRADEVGFRLDYSRNELRKCIKEYPGKEVGKFVSSYVDSTDTSKYHACQLKVHP